MWFLFSKRRRPFVEFVEYELPADVGVGQYVPVAREPNGPPTERRQCPRFAFPYRQPVAERVEPDHHFRALQCHDLSRSGFSYWTDREPESPVVLVDLGIGDEVQRVVAEVCHHTPLTVSGGHLWLVGCRVVGRG